VDVTVVNWDGNYVATSQPFQRTYTSGTGESTVAYSASQALNPVIGASYNGTSATFYGGYEVQSFDGSTPTWQTQSVVDTGATDSIELGTSTFGGTSGQRGQIFGLFLWSQPTFLNGGATETLTIDLNSTITIFGKSFPSGVDGRVILRDGSTLYVSDTNLGSGTGNETVGLTREWATYDPTTNLQFTGSTFSVHTFTNITGVGLYFYSFVNAGTSLSFSENGLAANLSAPYLPADVNHDGIVNGQDISLVASHWLQTGLAVPGDANGDQIVNGQDLALIASSWLQGPGVAPSDAVPEPSSLVLLAIAAIGLAGAGGRKRV
jgi:hypothetical protein